MAEKGTAVLTRDPQDGIYYYRRGHVHKHTAIGAALIKHISTWARQSMQKAPPAAPSNPCHTGAKVHLRKKKKPIDPIMVKQILRNEV